MDEALATTSLLKFARGEATAKRVRRDAVQLQQHLSALCRRRRDGEITVDERLNVVGQETFLRCDLAWKLAKKMTHKAQRSANCGKR